MFVYWQKLSFFSVRYRIITLQAKFVHTFCADSRICKATGNHKRVDGDRIITAVLAIIFCAAGTALTVLGWNIVQDAQASAAWPGVPGMVRESSVDSATDSDGNTTYAPQVTFTYAINGRPYEGHTIHFGETSYSSPTAAQAAANRYPRGQPVTVYFDPAQPEKAVLETGRNVGSYLVFAVGVLFLGMALLMGVQVALNVLLQRQTS